MLDNLPLTLLVVLNCWSEVGSLANDTGRFPIARPIQKLEWRARAANTSLQFLDDAIEDFANNRPTVVIAQTPPSSIDKADLNQPNNTSLPWPWILIGSAGSLGIGIGLYCLGRASVTHPHHSHTSNKNTHPSTPTHLPLHSHSPTSPKRQELSVTKINRVDTLLTDLRSQDAQKRRQAIWELGQRGTSEAIQPLVNVMVDADSQQRSLILGAIAEIGTRTLSPINRALMISLQDTNADVRQNAIRDLTRVYTLMAQMAQILTHAAADEDAEVQATAMWALEQFNRICNTTSVLVLESSEAYPPHLSSHEENSET